MLAGCASSTCGIFSTGLNPALALVSALGWLQACPAHTASCLHAPLLPSTDTAPACFAAHRSALHIRSSSLLQRIDCTRRRRRPTGEYCTNYQVAPARAAVRFRHGIPGAARRVRSHEKTELRCRVAAQAGTSKLHLRHGRQSVPQLGDALQNFNPVLLIDGRFRNRCRAVAQTDKSVLHLDPGGRCSPCWAPPFRALTVLLIIITLPIAAGRRHMRASRCSTSTPPAATATTGPPTAPGTSATCR